MDTIITRKTNKNKYLLIGLPIILLFGYVIFTSATKKRSLTIKKDEITIKTVENDFFEDFMSFQAKAAPLHSMLINIIEGGAVQEIFVENGDRVTKGQPLARLYNPNAELAYMQQETAIIEQINNLNKAKLDLRNQELNLGKDLLSIEHDYLDAKNLYDLNKKLFEQEILSNNEWEKTKENYRFQKERMSIIKQSVKKEKQANQIQIGQLNQSITIMDKSLDILRINKKNFLITAPLSGRLSSFEPILGKTYVQNTSIGTIDDRNGYKLVADLDEFYLARIAIGQKGAVDFDNKIIEVQITKLNPEIKNGRFQVELDFVSSKKLDLRQGLSFGVKLNLSEKTKTKVLSKGSFYEETNGKWIFVVNGNKAERRKIKLGRENPLYYEVLGGLKANEKVITSSYKDYAAIEVLNLD
ncbi:efflux RND transporter periplasmic adaptor subunit [Flavobacterium gawalongense]|uniref:HlyD family efflux transporter periplasmic adaptor subunit n=1 Tax=Flavobacterium gawalongense TaxID=2594432 RepID=A0A553BEP0_9FLAO|nr:HlyD family efflux transporter periplasmic adaptor subunit [Flavobacterium gawalongense]TRW99085.1 HlyD family efflux transporter periplasmic adaptor subunit [Flavobacterium gawalongense]TRX03793.1 HlyD family efflux transporter periplasmic adaptor subunit [Flavobacterium gawalongense]TRX06726.1 HlyD family efflux transporter periplasmic adaptor subunit [Flavobacterium gawalongense]TRX07577.1 HlyD family efflux transporter periplasmic adaptor subunit [Flavobacterium gawalongense]TRX23406.1 